MATDTFKPGDVVQLKSGGPKMTVTKVDNNAARKPTVWCVWFIGDRKESGAFEPSTLQIFD